MNESSGFGGAPKLVFVKAPITVEENVAYLRKSIQSCEDLNESSRIQMENIRAQIVEAERQLADPEFSKWQAANRIDIENGKLKIAELEDAISANNTSRRKYEAGLLEKYGVTA